MSKLAGTNAICAFAEKDHATLDTWRTSYEFPMWQEEAAWVSSQEKIKKWYLERGVDPKTVTLEDLKRFKWLKAKKEIAAKNKSNLVGINAIEAFAEIKYITLNGWRLNFDFPMWQEGENGIWVSTRSKIIKWYEERRVDPNTVTERDLGKYNYRKMVKAEKIKPLKRTLSGIEEIAEFAGFGAYTVYGWYLHWEECPIRRDKDSIFHVDADELLKWMNGRVADVVVNSDSMQEGGVS